MLTRIEVTKTYWIGVNSEQKDSLKDAIVTLVQSGQPEEMLDSEQLEAFNALRQALLNA